MAVGEEGRAPGVALETLSKVLRAECKAGCLNQVVIGGLDEFLARWRTDAESDGELPHSVTAMLDNLKGYACKSISDRHRALRGALDTIEQASQGRIRVSQQDSWQSRNDAPKQQGTQATTDLGAPVTKVRGVSVAMAKKLEALDIRTIGDLIYFFPRRYDDFSSLKTINQLRYGEEVTIVGIVRSVKDQQSRRGMHVTTAVVSDSTGLIQVTWFNQPYLTRRLVPGRRIVLSGTVDQYLGRIVFQSPEWEPWSTELIHTGRLVPIYQLTKGLPARTMRRLVKSAVETYAPRLADFMPTAVCEKYGLVGLSTAISQMHFPQDKESLEKARVRLCFDEFMLIQLGVLSQRRAWEAQPGQPLAVDLEAVGAFLQGLPFQLTSAQQRVIREITTDLQQSHPMSRLLEGDVGSGKTVVALTAMVVAARNGAQSVLMAPTEVLATQHCQTLTGLLRTVAENLADRDPEMARWVAGLGVALLVGGMPESEKEECRRRIAAGEVDIVVGTHAVIQEKVAFANLAFAVVDEQHRFGVAQRGALRQKGYNPHVLVMTATPIPRTLALTVYGDLDLSVIDELPPNRQQIVTRWLAPSERERAYSFLRSQVEQGRQAFVICPLIDESEKIEAKSAVTEYRRLKDSVFPDLRLGLLHGRMKGDEKELVMTQFREGEFDILVATPVVEVGIDVPNATVMLVEGADRFGLAQLHQFRGRVGRGQFKSYCLLLAGSPTLDGEKRLQVIETTHDGFALAEEDLKMRGPGEFFGTRQSGLPDLKVASLGDARILEQARQAAAELYAQDPTLAQPENRLLGEKVRQFWRDSIDLS